MDIFSKLYAVIVCFLMYPPTKVLHFSDYQTKSVKIRHKNAPVRLKQGDAYGVGTVWVWCGYSSGTVWVRYGYGVGTVRFR